MRWEIELANTANGEADRSAIRRAWLADEAAIVQERLASLGLDPGERVEISANAAALVEEARRQKGPKLLEGILARYGIATTEGTALLCLAEALLRVPDGPTRDELIADKLLAGNWNRSRASAATGGAAALGLKAAGSLVADGSGGAGVRTLLGPAARPVIRSVSNAAMRVIADRFVHGRDIAASFRRSTGWESRGYTHSYDMLGEGARTEADALRHLDRYLQLARALEGRSRPGALHENPGISIKLSAIHPRYESGKRETVVPELAERVAAICRIASRLDIGVSIDAEESERLELSLDIIEAILMREDLAGWEGFGTVVQAYGKRAMPVIDWVYDLAGRAGRRMCVRLVKGAYWDSEIKRAQVLGLTGFPVFTRKCATDVSYLACGRRLLGLTDRLYPQFGSHNAHTLSAILHMAPEDANFEFQRIHGMGEALHEIIRKRVGRRHRIYAPIGEYHDLLAYLVRRMLENGANSSFVQQIADTGTPAEEVAQDPVALAEASAPAYAHPRVTLPPEIFGSARRNAKGWDIDDFPTSADLQRSRKGFDRGMWETGPLLAKTAERKRKVRTVFNPAHPHEPVGEVAFADEFDVEDAFKAALAAYSQWSGRPADERAAILERAAELYENHAPELMALACREAGKTWMDAISEVREAVDFLRYYAGESRRYEGLGIESRRGAWIAISPWNFPLAIFTGQVAAPLAAGCVVLAKPARQTCLIAARAAGLLQEAGIPPDVLQVLPGPGSSTGMKLVGDPRVAGVGFTGSTETAHVIERAMARFAPPEAPLVAETGGLNAMIVDSTALPERAVDDIVTSAFGSAGQRCSALRILYIQKDGADAVLDMLRGAMDALKVGDPADLSTDVGPLIDHAAYRSIEDYVRRQTELGNLLHRGVAPDSSPFVAPTLIRASGIEALEGEVFGPVLHVATFAARELDAIVDRINASGYGLTMAVESRVERRSLRIAERAEVGNIYLDRNQIGAVVGSQPFGGEGMSGTGPKAGGPHTLAPHCRPAVRAPEPPDMTRTRTPIDAAGIGTALRRLARRPVEWEGGRIVGRIEAWLKGLSESVPDTIRHALQEAAASPPGPVELPGPTGERNLLSYHPRGVFLCLGDLRDPACDGFLDPALAQAAVAMAFGNAVLALTSGDGGGAPGLPLECLPGKLAGPGILADLAPLAGVCAWGEAGQLRRLRIALAERSGPLVPLVTDGSGTTSFFWERSLCADTTASGGNASLFVEAAEAA